MTKLSKNSNFLKLLLNTSRIQAIAILETITNKQTDCISEIVLNLVEGNIIKLNKNIEEILQSRKRILNILKDKNICSSKRAALIKSHPQVLLKTLKLIGDKVIQLC